MLSFIDYLEEAKKLKPLKTLPLSAKGEVPANTRGVLHELITGYHLNGGKHMNKHEDSEGLSPKGAHDRLKASIHPDDYKIIHDKAKSAAAHIHEHIKSQGRTITPGGIHWTSKAGDLHRSTKIHATQKEDSSDIVVDTSHPTEGNRYHGISLKSGATPKITTANNGVESLGTNGGAIARAHVKKIKAKYPQFNNLSKDDRSEAFKNSSPEIKADIKDHTTKTLHKIAHHLHKNLEGASRGQLVQHIRNLLHAHHTPMEAEGHEHIMHNTYPTAKGVQHATIHPATHWDHILNNPNIPITTSRTGASISFSHPHPETGKMTTIARQSPKVSTGSDPHGGGFVSTGTPG